MPFHPRFMPHISHCTSQTDGLNNNIASYFRFWRPLLIPVIPRSVFIYLTVCVYIRCCNTLQHKRNPLTHSTHCSPHTAPSCQLPNPSHFTILRVYYLYYHHLGHIFISKCVNDAHIIHGAIWINLHRDSLIILRIFGLGFRIFRLYLCGVPHDMIICHDVRNGPTTMISACHSFGRGVVTVG